METVSRGRRPAPLRRSRNRGQSSYRGPLRSLTGQLKRSVVRPGIYAKVSNFDRRMETMNANRFERSQYRLWSAHHTGAAHVCGPAACKLCDTACDWTQFTNRADNSSLDESTLGTDTPTFTKPVAAKAAAAPAAPAVTLAEVESDLTQIESYVKARA